MDNLERVAYICFGFLALLYAVALVVGMIAAFPYGILGLIGILGGALLVIKVIKERVQNTQDDYYDKNVDK